MQRERTDPSWEDMAKERGKDRRTESADSGKEISGGESESEEEAESSSFPPPRDEAEEDERAESQPATRPSYVPVEMM